MSFLFPAFLFGALAIAIPIILHLIKREVAPRLPFSDIRFLTRAPVTQARRKRRREWLLLALRVTALLLLALAFARPFFDATGTLGRPVTIIAVDRSFSMSPPPRFERARALARDVIDETPGDHLIGVVAFDDAAELIREPSIGRAGAASAITALETGSGATRYAAALGAAVDAVGARDGRVVVVTDLQRSGWDQPPRPVPDTVTVEVRDVGTAESNLAVVSVERSATGVRAVVLNTSVRTRETTITVAVDGEVLVDGRPLTAPSGTIETAVEVDLPATGAVRVTVTDDEGASADDTRHLLLDPPEPPMVALVTDDGRVAASAFYLDRALGAGEESAFATRIVSPGALSSPTSDILDDVAGVIVVVTQGLERQGRARLASFVEAGGGVLIVAGPALDAALVADVFGDRPRVELREPAAGEPAEQGWTVTDSRHPVFRPFGGFLGAFGQVRFRQAMVLEGADDEPFRVIARFDDGTAALAEYDVGRGRALVFASDLNNEWNDFPRRPTYVPFVHEVTRYLAGARPSRRDFPIADRPAGVDPRPGVATVPETGRRITLNVDPRESAAATTTGDEFLARLEFSPPSGVADPDVGGAAEREDDQRYWWYALVALMVVLVAETLLGRTMAG